MLWLRQKPDYHFRRGFLSGGEFKLQLSAGNLQLRTPVQHRILDYVELDFHAPNMTSFCNKQENYNFTSDSPKIVTTTNEIN
jgi:hypothetical protein